MTAATTPPIHVLRGILRHIKKTAPSSSTTAAATSSSQSSSNSGNELSLSEHVISQYRQSISAVAAAPNLRKVAYDYLNLKKDLTERARLHELDSGADVKLSPRELSRRAAARAGLQLPVMDDGHVDQ